ncbi:MAG: hypothetical protein ACR2M0_01125 [Chloroflexia bacterium]
MQAPAPGVAECNPADFGEPPDFLVLSDVEGLAILLGHSSLDTTRLYSEPAGADLAGRLEKLALNADAEGAPPT